MIATAIQHSPTLVYAYDEKGNYKFSVPGILVGFTSSTVTVKPSPDSNQVKVYDDKGRYKFGR